MFKLFYNCELVFESEELEAVEAYQNILFHEYGYITAITYPEWYKEALVLAGWECF